jgi:hypothetical protein
MVLAPATPPPIQSWADAEHGWKAAGPGVEASDDGGRHWRVVFRYGDGGAAEVVSLLRTSPTVGLVGLEYGGFVTNDAGRHWYLTSENVPGGDLFGHGSLLYGVGNASIVQAVSWPPRTLRCRGKWFHQIAGGLNAFGPKPRTICLEGPGISIPARTVYTLPQPMVNADWGLFGQVLIPGGLLASVYDLSAEPHVVPLEGELVYRNGVGTLHQVPGADNAYAYVDWPRIALVGGTVTWTSDDGGDTWTSPTGSR